MTFGQKTNTAQAILRFERHHMSGFVNAVSPSLF